MTERQPHPVADIFPMMSELEFSGLVDDIKLNGLREPVWLHRDGRIIDGRNRFRACSQLGLEVSEQAGTCRIYQGDDDGLVAFVVSLNLHRRHLDSDQRSMVAARIANLPHGTNQHNQDTEISVSKMPDVAQMLKVSEDSIQAARKVLASEDKDLIKEAEKGRKDGGLSISAAAAAAGLAEGKRKQFLAQADRDRTARMAKQMKRDEAEARQAIARLREPDPISEPVALPVGLYQSVVIDPPWPVQKIEREERPDQGVSLNYRTLPIWCQEPEWTSYEDHRGVKQSISHPCCEAIDPDDEEPYEPCQSIECIVADVLRNVADDSHIYLWVTHKFLPDGLSLFKTWGFSYQCVMTWRKNVGITPFSWMYDTEHVLFGRRGNLPLTRLGLRLSFEAKAQGHSIKPDIFYDRVRAASPGPRLDMFPGVQHEGFEPWGLEASHRAG